MFFQYAVGFVQKSFNGGSTTSSGWEQIRRLMTDNDAVMDFRIARGQSKSVMTVCRSYFKKFNVVVVCEKKREVSEQAG